jgi:hypothetical protein
LTGEALNVHRRHSESVTMQNYDVQLEEIKQIHKLSSQFVNIDEKQQTAYLSEVRRVLEGGS